MLAFDRIYAQKSAPIIFYSKRATSKFGQNCLVLVTYLIKICLDD